VAAGINSRKMKMKGVCEKQL